MKTALYEDHKSLGAKLVDFAGYEMPISYKTIKEEYESVRKDGSGIFDICHMAPIFIKGSNKEIVDFLNFLTSKDISDLTKGQVQYNCLLNSDGGLIDDITVYYLETNTYVIVVNASNKHSVIDHLKSKNQNEGLSIQLLEDYVLLAIQGKKSEEVLIKSLQKLKPYLEDLFYYECKPVPELSDTNLISFISRTGYTGEDGFEILLPIDDGKKLWKNLIENSATPCGLAARDLLRMEVGYPLYGNELSATKSPYESGLGWLVSGDKDFLAKDKVLQSKENFKRRIRFFQLAEQGIPRSGFKILDKNQNEIGEVTSGAYSFIWSQGFGMAFIDKSFKKGNEAYISIRDQKKKINLFNVSPYKGSIKRRPKES